MLNISSQTSNMSGSSEQKPCSNPYIRDPNHTMRLRDLTRCTWDNKYPFWTCHPSGNLVDGLPLAIHKDAVLTSCRFFMRAPIRKFRCKILDYACNYRLIMRVNFRDSILPHIDNSKPASESSKLLDHRRVLSVPNFRKY